MKFFLILLVILSPAILTAQDFGIWMRGDTAGFTPRYGLASAAIGDTIYIMGGNQNNYHLVDQTNLVEAYNIATNRWRTPPVTKDTLRTRQLFAAAALGGKIYAIGGTDNADLNSVDMYDPANNSWKPVTPMTTTRNGLTASVVRGKIYAIGGTNTGGWLESVEAYDTAKKTWQQFTTSGWFHPMANMSASVIGDSIYIVGGYDGSIALDSVFIFNTQTSTWTSPAVTGYFSPRRHHSAAVLGGKIYIFGGAGDDLTVPTDSVNVFDPLTNSWNPVITKDTMIARYDLTASVVGSKAYLFGGIVSTSQFPLNTTEIFTPSTSGVSSYTSSEDIFISPNPAKEIISIHGNNLQRAVLINMLGNSIAEKQCRQTSACEFDLSSAPTGVYYIKVFVNDRVIVRKILRN